MVRTALVTASILGILLLSACGDDDSQRHSDVCVAMAGSNGQVGGLQMDLTWDSACMTAVRAAGNSAQCTSNRSTGKSVQTSLLSDAQMRVLFFSVSDESPVPDGELFCCRFAVAPSQADSCCSINVTDLVLASPTGRIYDPGITVQASVGGAACAASAQEAPIPPMGL